MKKLFARIITPVFISALLFSMQGCVKNKCTSYRTYTYFLPVYKSFAEVRANIKSNAPRAIANPGKIYIKGNYIFLNEINKGIHVINNANPAAPVNAAFIDLPGNVDIAIKENTLYADFYTDLVAMDISNPTNISVTKFVDNIFPERYYWGYDTDSSKVITDWLRKTETVEVNCNGGGDPVGIFTVGGGMMFNAADAGLSSTSAAAASPVGISGSLARFALVNDYLYAVSYDSLKLANVSVPANPVRANAINLGWGIETIYPFKDKLFIGSNSGMFIYGLQDPLNPVQLGTFAHVRTCDPVIADDNFAYVTLHSGSICAGFTNQLDVLDISNVLSPQHVKTYQLTNPRGLSKDGNLLFICDGEDGLKIFDASNVNSITLKKQFGMQLANDVIAYNNIALVIASDGLYQYDYSDPADIKLISKIAVQNN